MHAPKDVPPELASCYEYPLLTKEQEQHQFRKMNYLKHKAAKLRDQMRKEGEDEIDPSRVRIQTLTEIEELQTEANAVKAGLLVWAVPRRRRVGDNVLAASCVRPAPSRPTSPG